MFGPWSKSGVPQGEVHTSWVTSLHLLSDSEAELVEIFPIFWPTFCNWLQFGHLGAVIRPTEGPYGDLTRA